MTTSSLSSTSPSCSLFRLVTDTFVCVQVFSTVWWGLGKERRSMCESMIFVRSKLNNGHISCFPRCHCSFNHSTGRAKGAVTMSRVHIHSKMRSDPKTTKCSGTGERVVSPNFPPRLKSQLLRLPWRPVSASLKRRASEKRRELGGIKMAISSVHTTARIPASLWSPYSFPFPRNNNQPEF